MKATGEEVLKPIWQGYPAMLFLLGLMFFTIFTSKAPSYCFLLAGILLFLLMAQSLSDHGDWRLYVLQAAASMMFVLYANAPFACMIFYLLKSSEKRRWLRAFFPACGYLLVSLIAILAGHAEAGLPYHILALLFLMLGGSLLFLLEELFGRYREAKAGLQRDVSITAVNELYEKKLNQELRMKHYLAEKNVRLEEREAISRQIHNSAGHSLTAAVLALEAADMLMESEPIKAREKVAAANERIRTSLNDIRTALRVLDREWDTIPLSELVEELTLVGERFAADTDVRVQGDISGFDQDIEMIQIPYAVVNLLTGALRECLSNGVRHGKADIFTVNLAADSSHIRLKIKDNGRSDFSDENRQKRIAGGFGLKKLIAGMQDLGGQVLFDNHNGFSSEFTLPLFEENEGVHE